MGKFIPQTRREKFQGFAGSLLVGGWGILVLGAAAVAFFLYSALQPNESMTILGFVTNERHAKLVATEEVAIIPIVGAIVLFGLRKIILAMMPNQSTDPTLASGTSPAGQEPRLR
jgi:hypothetical protein